MSFSSLECSLDRGATQHANLLGAVEARLDNSAASSERNHSESKNEEGQELDREDQVKKYAFLS